MTMTIDEVLRYADAIRQSSPLPDGYVLAVERGPGYSLEDDLIVRVSTRTINGDILACTLLRPPHLKATITATVDGLIADVQKRAGR